MRQSEDNKSKEEEIKKLVLMRLLTLPENIKISIGSIGVLSKDELINEVERGSKTGELIIKIQLNYLRSFKKGIIKEITA